MTTNSITNSPSLGSSNRSNAKDKPKRSWNPFTRIQKPAMNPAKWKPFVAKKQAMDELRAEQQSLFKALEKLNERLEAAPAETAAAIDPMPVVKSIQGIQSGQQDISKGIAGLSQHMEKAEKTSERIISSISSVDEAIGGVRSSQAETTSAITSVGEQITAITGRFESLFTKMQAAELKMAADYRKFQQRTLIAVGSVATTVVIAAALLIALPWG